MDAHDETGATALITATGLGVDGEHGPLFSAIDLALPEGFHAIQMPGGPGQTALLLTLAGRFKPSHGSLTVLGDTTPRAIRRHCAIAAFPDIDELEESVTVHTVLAEQLRWLAPWYAQVPREASTSTLSRSIRRHCPTVYRHLHRRIVRPGAFSAPDRLGNDVEPSDPGGRRPRASTRQRAPRHRGGTVGRAGGETHRRRGRDQPPRRRRTGPRAT